MIALLFGVFAVALVLGVPIAFTILIASIVVLLSEDISLLVVTQRMFASVDSFPLMAIPFFIFSGDIMARGTISKYLVGFAEAMIGRIRGGLSVVSVAATMLFAAISGSGAATTAAAGTTLIPQLKERGYNEASAAALIASAGTIGVIFPPSVPMVLYAVVAEQSVTALFRNGFLPGFMMGGCLMVIALIQAYKHNYPPGAAFSFRNLFVTLKKAVWGLLMPFIILGGIFSGTFTPSEAAVVAVVYALAVSKFVYRDLTLKGLYQTMAQSARTTAIIMIVIASSGPFGWILANWRIPQQVAALVLEFSGDQFVVMFLIALILLFFGIFMETASVIIILTPVFLPLVNGLGIDLVHFGIVVVFSVAIGMITPPIAINLFVASSITGLPIERISKAVIPYIIGGVLIFMLVLFLPMLLPGLIF